MEIVRVINSRVRMCENSPSCHGCPFSESGTPDCTSDGMGDYPEEYENIIERWLYENPDSECGREKNDRF